MILTMMLAATIMMADATPAASASATAAATPAPAAAAAAAKAPARPTDHVVCKTEAVTGSMFPKKTCYSTKDLEQRQQEERSNLEKIQQNSHQ